MTTVLSRALARRRPEGEFLSIPQGAGGFHLRLARHPDTGARTASSGTGTSRHRPDINSLSKKTANVLVTGLLISTLIAAGLVFGGSTVPFLFGKKTMVVTSGSMEPAIGVGDAAIISPTAAEAPEVGDVITYNSVDGQGMTTHRVMAVSEIDGTTYFQTKGDFNRTPDPNLTPSEAVHGKVVLVVPKFGLLLSFSATPLGKLLLIGVPLTLLMGKELGGWLRPRKPVPPADEPQAAG